MCDVDFLCWCGRSLFCIKHHEGNIYFNMSELFAFPHTENKRETTVVFQHDGILPHFTCKVCHGLNAGFPNVWIGRSEPIIWSPGSSNLTPLDLFMWGYVRNIVLAENISDLNEV
jgi:hypothetical protein